MKKAITAGVLVAFMGAVAFASLSSRDSSVKKQEIKKEQKETKKKKECRRTCIFS